MPEQPPKAVEKLADHINELESLIDARKAAGGSTAPIPILDDVVEPGADSAAAPVEPAAGTELEQRLLRRVDAELGELSQVIREVIRRCIRDELARGSDSSPPATGKDG